MKKTKRQRISSKKNQLARKKKQAPKNIPINDPDEALRFCRWLVIALQKPVTSSKSILDPNKSLIDELSASIGLSDANKPTISVVIPIFNEEDNLLLLFKRLTKVLKKMESNYELIFIDDGSQDKSKEILKRIASKNPRVIVIELSRNFGHQVAISAGLDYSQGKAVIIMDADLQDPPEVLPKFIKKWQQGYEVVYAIRTQRRESRIKRLAYSVFYRLLQKIANIEIPLDAGDFCIMDRRVVDILVSMPERNRFLRGIRSWVGLNQVGLEYERHARHSGRPKFTFSRLIYLALDGLVSFSYIPLRAISVLGFTVSLVSFLLAVRYIVQKLTTGLNPPGFATTIVAIFFLAGIQLITIGVIGEYVGRIFEEIKRRPLYVIRKVTKSRTS